MLNKCELGEGWVVVERVVPDCRAMTFTGKHKGNILHLLDAKSGDAIIFLAKIKKEGSGQW